MKNGFGKIEENTDGVYIATIFNNMLTDIYFFYEEWINFSCRSSDFFNNTMSM